jgi:tetratricopeptide (TPR) repeat protein
MLLIPFYLQLNAQKSLLKKVDKYLVAKDTSKALTHLNKQIVKHPTEGSLYLKRAEVKIERGDLDPAMVDLNTYCSLEKRCEKATYLKGIIRYKQQDYHGAIEHFSEFSKNSENENGWMYLGLCHLAMQNFQVAQNAFERCLEVNPENFNAIYNAGLAAYQDERYVTAIEFFVKATQMNGESLPAWIGLGLSQNGYSKFEQSNLSLRNALAIQPNNGSALYNIGVNYYNLNDTQNACEYWQRAEKSASLPAQLALEQFCQEK